MHGQDSTIREIKSGKKLTKNQKIDAPGAGDHPWRKEVSKYSPGPWSPLYIRYKTITY